MLNDGEYNINVELQGGSGKATITSPTKLSVTDGKMQAEIEWSSSHYDYMEVDGKDFYPINTEGNSLFLIDVPGLDTDIPIKAETIAMSEPHLIEYTIKFDSSTITQKIDSGNSALLIGTVIGMISVVAVITILIGKKKSNVKS